jgi:hypothetical protein
MSVSRSLLPCLVALLGGCEAVTSPFDTGVGAVTGRLVDPSPAGVLVWIALDGDRALTATSAADGRFLIEEVPVGVHAVFALSEQDRAARVEARVVQGRRVDLGDIPLADAPCLSGVGRLADDAVPSPFEVVHPVTGRWSWSLPDGRFQLRLPPGEHRLRVRGMNLVDVDVTLVSGPSADCGSPGQTVRIELAADPEPIRFVELAPMPVPAGSAASAVYGRELWVVSGSSCPTGSCASMFGAMWRPYQTAAVQVLDLGTGTWREGPNVPDPRTGARAAVLGDALYVVGGWGRVLSDCPGEPCYRDEVLRLDLGTERWFGADEGVPRFPRRIGYGGLVGDAERLLYVGGLGGGYRSEVVAMGADGVWSDTSLGGRARAWLWTCRVGRTLVALSGSSFFPGGAQIETPAVCRARPEQLDLDEGTVRGGGLAPTVPGVSDGPCAALGAFVYLANARGSAHYYRYDLRTERFALEATPDTFGDGSTLAMPWGFVVLGEGASHGHSTGRVVAAVAERFYADARSRFGRAPLDAGPPGLANTATTSEAQYGASCRLRGCFQTCGGDEEPPCIFGHACIGGRCLPEGCLDCPDRCALLPEDRRPPTSVIVEGDEYLACSSWSCES